MIGTNGKNPYKYKTLEAFLKEHPKQKGSSDFESELNWYNWEISGIENPKKPKK